MANNMDKEQIRNDIAEGNTSLGIELGSTRIKAVLIDSRHTAVASGTHGWENKLEHGLWTYDLDDVWQGVQCCYAALRQDVSQNYGIELDRVGSMGISGMMHGYLVFDEKGELLVPFRTWRNTITADASRELTELFGYPVPHRWSIAHLYQAILNGEEHVGRVAYMTTLAGYVHGKLTGQKVIGVGDASGMFPIDSALCDYHAEMVRKFDELISEKGFAWKLGDLLPRVLTAGEKAGELSPEGAKLLDGSGRLKPGQAFCPPEGDAGTGMAATNSVTPRTGNVSAGTSIFLMAVLEKELKAVHPELDLVTTPDAKPVAMVHCNNCTGEIDAWVKIFADFCEAAGVTISKAGLYDLLYEKALMADPDCGGLLAYNYISGESITGIDEGRPFFMRSPDAAFTLANFMRTQLYSALATLRIGFDVLTDKEGVTLDNVYGHGGYFKTAVVGQQMMAAALKTPVTVAGSAAEGGPWGMALLAAYMRNRAADEPLCQYLEEKVYRSASWYKIVPEDKDMAGFDAFMQRYLKAFTVEKCAGEISC